MNFFYKTISLLRRKMEKSKPRFNDSGWLVCDLNPKTMLDYLDTYYLDDNKYALRYSFIYNIINHKRLKLNNHFCSFSLFIHKNPITGKKNAFFSFNYTDRNGCRKRLKFGLSLTHAMFIRRKYYEPPKATPPKNKKGGETSNRDSQTKLLLTV